MTFPKIHKEYTVSWLSDIPIRDRLGKEDECYQLSRSLNPKTHAIYYPSQQAAIPGKDKCNKNQTCTRLPYKHVPWIIKCDLKPMYLMTVVVLKFPLKIKSILKGYWNETKTLWEYWTTVLGFLRPPQPSLRHCHLPNLNCRSWFGSGTAKTL